ncbi:hypothetical protein PoB_007355400 [Plakobranchus ocellatus]|uniref:Fatty-acid and retinol-binding protein 1 n=1 Tax=Plakobranchus ocellatus TaxID=259542 RepID=A0AAV4DS30_9GAST|nr:hypothetical protein PoB_007355400 [Plakobranchus ocellatus]
MESGQSIKLEFGTDNISGILNILQSYSVVKMKLFVASVAIFFFAVFAKGQILLPANEDERDLMEFAKSLKEDNLTQNVLDYLDHVEEFVRNVDGDKIEEMRQKINDKIDGVVAELEGMDRKAIPGYLLNVLNEVKNKLVSNKKNVHFNNFVKATSMSALKDALDEYSSISDEDLDDVIEAEAQQLKDYLNKGLDEIENEPEEVIGAIEDLKKMIQFLAKYN